MKDGLLSNGFLPRLNLNWLGMVDFAPNRFCFKSMSLFCYGAWTNWIDLEVLAGEIGLHRILPSFTGFWRLSRRLKEAGHCIEIAPTMDSRMLPSCATLKRVLPSFCRVGLSLHWDIHFFCSLIRRTKLRGALPSFKWRQRSKDA